MSAVEALTGASASAPTGDFVQVQTALENAAKLYRHTFVESQNLNFDLDQLRRVLMSGVRDLLTRIMEDDEQVSVKWWAALFLEFYLASDVSSVTDPPVTFRSEPFALMGGMPSEQLTTQLQAVHNHFVLSAETFTGQGSGYVISRLLRLEISTIEYDPIRTGTYIALPAKLQNPKKGLINIRSNDNRCLLYCLVMWRKLCEEAASSAIRNILPGAIHT